MRKSEERTLKESIETLINAVREVFKTSLPPEFIILDNERVMAILKISKRKLALMRTQREIEYHPSEERIFFDPKTKKVSSAKGQKKSKRSGKIYYTLRGLLNYIQRFTIKPIYEQLNFTE